VKIEFKKSFSKDLDAMSDAKLSRRVQDVLLRLETTPTLANFPHLESLSGHPGHFRIRIGSHRLGLRLVGDTVVCVRFLHRREVYRYFP
jgi:mRNA interferase RelE/StbE